MDAIILAGGRGTRLGSLGDDSPKVLLELGSRTILDYVIDIAVRAGARRIVFAVGHRADRIFAHIDAVPKPAGVEYAFSEENQPLGTGGGIKKALGYVKSDHVLIINGDTIVLDELSGMFKGNEDGITIAVAEVDDVAEHGSVELAARKIAKFVEKTGIRRKGWVSAGIYSGRTDIFVDNMPKAESFSIEHDFLERIEPLYYFKVSKFYTANDEKQYMKLVREFGK